MNPFQQIPPAARRWLYLTYALVGLVLGGCLVIDVDTINGFAVERALALLAYVGTALGFTAASNVTQANTVEVTAPETVEVTVGDPEIGDH